MAKIMKITGAGPVVTTSPGGRSHVDSAVPQKKGALVSEMDPELSSIGLSEAVSKSQDVDISLVESVKNQISEGKLSLDPKKLAEAIMDMHSR
jgi:flagellar biosynthesis anti-sigma factor FlgM